MDASVITICDVAQSTSNLGPKHLTWAQATLLRGLKHCRSFMGYGISVTSDICFGVRYFLMKTDLARSNRPSRFDLLVYDIRSVADIAGHSSE